MQPRVVLSVFSLRMLNHVGAFRMNSEQWLTDHMLVQTQHSVNLIQAIPVWGCHAKAVCSRVVVSNSVSSCPVSLHPCTVYAWQMSHCVSYVSLLSSYDARWRSFVIRQNAVAWCAKDLIAVYSTATLLLLIWTIISRYGNCLLAVFAHCQKVYGHTCCLTFFLFTFLLKINRMQKLLKLFICFKLGVFAYLLHYCRCNVIATLLPQKVNNSHCCLINALHL